MITFKEYVKEHLLEGTNYNDYMNKPEYDISRGIMKMQYEMEVLNNER